ncbi:hypothetical protein EON67_11060 [archaeon]|nr:MAG: hypothetical protein EON67_11060 [archaeon]
MLLWWGGGGEHVVHGSLLVGKCGHFTTARHVCAGSCAAVAAARMTGSACGKSCRVRVLYGCRARAAAAVCC